MIATVITMIFIRLLSIWVVEAVGEFMSFFALGFYIEFFPKGFLLSGDADNRSTQRYRNQYLSN